MSWHKKVCGFSLFLLGKKVQFLINCGLDNMRTMSLLAVDCEKFGLNFEVI